MASMEDTMKEMMNKFTEVLAQNATLMQLLAQRNQNQSGETVKLMSTLASRLPVFEFDDKTECSFSTWLERHKSVLEVDGASLEDKDRCRLLVEKLSEECFAKYKQHILPEEPSKYSFEETVTKLKVLFDRKQSLFTQRHQVLRIEKNYDEDYLSYTGRVNELCEKAEIGKVKSDEWKCLLWVFGLKDQKDAELRKRLILFMDMKHQQSTQNANAQAITLQDMYEECERHQSTLRDAKLVGSSNGSRTEQSASVCAVSQDRSQCWNCGGSHLRHECRRQQSRCKNCDEPGHLEQFCDRIRKWKTTNASRKSKAKGARVYAVEVEPKACDSSKNQVLKLQSKLFGAESKAGSRSSDAVLKLPRKSFVVESKAVKSVLKLERSIKINGTVVDMEVDTGARVSLISEAVWRRLGKPRLRKSSIEVRGPSREMLVIKGVLDCRIMVDGYETKCEAYVNPHKNLFGRDWIWKVPQLKYHARMLMGNSLVVDEDKVKPKVARRQRKCAKKDVDICYVEANAVERAVEPFRLKDRRIRRSKADSVLANSGATRRADHESNTKGLSEAVEVIRTEEARKSVALQPVEAIREGVWPQKTVSKPSHLMSRRTQVLWKSWSKDLQLKGGGKDTEDIHQSASPFQCRRTRNLLNLPLHNATKAGVIDSMSMKHFDSVPIKDTATRKPFITRLLLNQLPQELHAQPNEQFCRKNQSMVSSFVESHHRERSFSDSFVTSSRSDTLVSRSRATRTILSLLALCNNEVCLNRPIVLLVPPSLPEDQALSRKGRCCDVVISTNTCHSLVLRLHHASSRASGIVDSALSFGRLRSVYLLYR